MSMTNAVKDNFRGKLVSPRHLAEVYSTNQWFRNGYLNAFKDQPYEYDIPLQSAATAYERGRAFAIWSKANKMPRAVWRNGITAKTVRDRLVLAICQRAVI